MLQLLELCNILAIFGKINLIWISMAADLQSLPLQLLMRGKGVFEDALTISYPTNLIE